MSTDPIPKRRRRTLRGRVASPARGFRRSRNSSFLRPTSAHLQSPPGGMDDLPPCCSGSGARRLWHSALHFAFSIRFSSLQSIAQTLLYMDLGLT
ncbi:hypothetical protein SORBI_3003G388800 [Sorghum bicolor]|uniref:Uncharacterized protein n=1 Tax=Sorghum bicolor TaxID=4558 RepID=A0A1B6Q7K3_SORBI|nr:hypothetical protein SORBI_3003G388800 [Sorghum bicolor]